jgi:hypothetical protein
MVLAIAPGPAVALNIHRAAKKHRWMDVHVSNLHVRAACQQPMLKKTCQSCMSAAPACQLHVSNLHVTKNDTDGIVPMPEFKQVLTIVEYIDRVCIYR